MLGLVAVSVHPVDQGPVIGLADEINPVVSRDTRLHVSTSNATVCAIWRTVAIV